MYGDLMLRFLQILMDILSIRGALEQGACLDALTSLMLDSSANQLVFCCLFLVMLAILEDESQDLKKSDVL